MRDAYLLPCTNNTRATYNALANEMLHSGQDLLNLYRVTAEGSADEARWTADFGNPRWNRRLELSQEFATDLDHPRR